MSYDEDPLELLEDDGDGVIEIGLFFDDEKETGKKKSPQGNSGCGLAMIIMGGTLSTIGYGVSKLFL